MMTKRSFSTLLLALTAAGPSTLTARAEPDVDPARTVRVSIRSEGLPGLGTSWGGSLSANGRYVAFWSDAPNLVEGDTNRSVDKYGHDAGTDVFVHDRDTDRDGVYDERGAISTKRVSVRSDGGESHGTWKGSRQATISANGRVVVFESDADDLVPGVSGGPMVYAHDLRTRTTVLVSVSSGGDAADGYSPSISANGRFVAFTSYADLVPGDTNDAGDAFVRDLLTGQTTRVSVSSEGAQGYGWGVPHGAIAISGDGAKVAFSSFASNLVPGDTNEASDVFLHDLLTSKTIRVSVGVDGEQGNSDSQHPALNHDGNILVFRSWATNLFPSDTNGQSDVFAYEARTKRTELVSVSSSGEPGNSMSRVPERSPNNVVSADGRYIAFTSASSNFEPGSAEVDAVIARAWLEEVFVRDRIRGETWRASSGSAGTPGGGASEGTMSADARHVSFASSSPTYDVGDLNADSDVFVRSRGAGVCPTPNPCVLAR